MAMNVTLLHWRWKDQTQSASIDCNANDDICLGTLPRPWFNFHSRPSVSFFLQPNQKLFFKQFFEVNPATKDFHDQSATGAGRKSPHCHCWWIWQGIPSWSCHIHRNQSCYQGPIDMCSLKSNRTVLNLLCISQHRKGWHFIRTKNIE